MSKPYWVYIALCSDGTYYTGIALDVDKRIEQHNLGKGAKYTRSRRPVACAYREMCDDKGEALRRERAVKSLSRVEKQQLIEGYAVSFTLQETSIESE